MAEFHPLRAALVIGSNAVTQPSEGGEEAGLGREGAWPRAPDSRALSPLVGVTGSALARPGCAQPARGRKSSVSRREVLRTGAAAGAAAGTRCRARRR